MTTGTFKRFWRVIPPQRRRQMTWLLAFTILASFTEVFSIGAVLPFLGVLTSPDSVYRHPMAQKPIDWLGVTQPSELLVPVTILFCAAACAAGAVRVLALWLRTRLSFAAGADLSNEIYRRTLYQPYVVHIARNSSEIIDAMSGKVNTVIFSVLNPFLLLVSNAVMLMVIVGAILLFQPFIALFAFAGFASIYWIIYRVSREQLAANSRAIAFSATRRVQLLQEGLGGIRDILLDRSQPVYCTEYAAADRTLRKAQSYNAVAADFPRFAVEGLGMCLIALMALGLARRSNGIQAVLPLMGMLAIAATRMLPLLQQIYFGASTLKASRQSLADTLSLLEQPVSEAAGEHTCEPLPFSEAIVCRDLGFQYNINGPWQLRSVNLEIPKGTRVGIVGTTGSGKSTLLDVIMGLLIPSRGALLVDGVQITASNAGRWQRRVAHVPQAIYLSDATVAENIAFGVPQNSIDMARVERAAAVACLHETVTGWLAGYATVVGERGVRLSGGQRQRIGIARALYKGADVLVFDEATSALDLATEEQLMRNIDKLGAQLTILMVAHRIQSLNACEMIFRVEDGRIEFIGTYDALGPIKNQTALEFQ
jgi:ATP-binding cassette subfamily B protein